MDSHNSHQLQCAFTSQYTSYPPENQKYEVVKLEDKRYVSSWETTPTIYITAARMLRLIQVVDDMAVIVKDLQKQITDLRTDVSTLKSENEALQQDNAELRIACTAISEQEVNRVKKHFVDCSNGISVPLVNPEMPPLPPKKQIIPNYHLESK